MNPRFFYMYAHVRMTRLGRFFPTFKVFTCNVVFLIVLYCKFGPDVNVVGLLVVVVFSDNNAFCLFFFAIVRSSVY